MPPLNNINDTYQAIEQYPNKKDNPGLKVVISTPTMVDVVSDMLIACTKRFFAIHPSTQSIRWVGDYKSSGEAYEDETKIWIRDTHPENAAHFPCIIIKLQDRKEKSIAFGREMTLAQDEENLEIDNVAERSVKGGMVEGVVLFVIESLGNKLLLRRTTSKVIHGLTTRSKRENTIVSLARTFGIVLNEFKINWSNEEATEQIKNDLIYTTTVEIPFFYTWEDTDWMDYYYCLIEHDTGSYVVRKSGENLYYVKILTEDNELLDVDDDIKEIIIDRYLKDIDNNTIDPIMVRTIKLVSQLSE
jgi:hypothetical protein